MEGIGCVTKNQVAKPMRIHFRVKLPSQSKIVYERHAKKKKQKNPKLFFVKSKRKKKKKNIFLFFVMILVRQQSLMISTKEFHQQIESLAVSFAFDGQHIFANLTGAFQFGYPEQKFSKLRRHVWIVRKRVLLQGFEH